MVTTVVVSVLAVVLVLLVSSPIWLSSKALQWSTRPLAQREFTEAASWMRARWDRPWGQPSVDKITPVKSDPTGLFLIDERCPGCLGSGRLRVDILEDDIAEERMWRELELKATLKDPWQAVWTCTGCGLPFVGHENVPREWCSVECQSAYYKRGKVPLIPVDLDITTHGDSEPQTMKGYVVE